MLVIVRSATPLLVSVTVLGALVVPINWSPNGKSPLMVKIPVKDTSGPVTTLVPVNATDCVPAPASSVIFRVPGITPPPMGRKATSTPQLAPAARVEEQGLD